MKSSRVLCLIISLCLIFAALPFRSFAAEGLHMGRSGQIVQLDPGTRYVLTDEDRAWLASGECKPEKPLLPCNAKSTGDPGVFNDVDEALKYLREQMALRKGPVTLAYYANPTEELLNELVNYTVLGFFDHTGIGNQGDYFLYHIISIGIDSISYDDIEGILYIVYNFRFFTDAEQEKAVGDEISAVFDSLHLTGMTAYERFSAIYEYMTHNIVYDYDNLYDDEYLLKYTAYAAIIDKQAVCQGYANLLYRMLLDAGIDCRVISGTCSGGGHAWNIVRLGDFYYNVDSTWDASGVDVYDWEGNYLYKEYPMTYRLRCNANFPDHERDADYDSPEFHQAYPMADSDFDPDSYAGDGVEILDLTEGSADCTVEGDIVTVRCGVPCKVGYVDESGSIVSVEMTAVEGQPDMYTFTAEGGMKEYIIVVKGDVDLSGEFDFFDVVTAKAMDLYPEGGYDELQFFAGDVDSDGEFGFFDVILMKAADLGKTLFEW